MIPPHQHLSRLNLDPQRPPINHQILPRHKPRLHKILRRADNILSPPRPIRRMQLHIPLLHPILPLHTFFLPLPTLMRNDDLPGTDHVDADPERRQADGHRVHEADEPRFGGGVAFLVGVGLERAEGADEEDAGACVVFGGGDGGVGGGGGGGGAHGGNAGLGDGEGGGEVGFDVGLPLVYGFGSVEFQLLAGMAI